MVTIDQAGGCEFRLFLPDARRVQLVGDFTGWQERPIEMLRTPDGWWTTREAMIPGDYQFQYLIDDVAWIADYAASGVRRNDFGLWVSQLHVPEPVKDAAPETTAPEPMVEESPSRRLPAKGHASLANAA